MQDVWHNSGFQTLRLCEQKFVYREFEGLESQEVSVPLMVGSWFHALMQAQGLRQGAVRGTLLHPVPLFMDLGFDTVPETPTETFGDPEDRDFVARVHQYIIERVHDYLPTGDEDIDAMPDNVWFLYERYLAAHIDDVMAEEVLGVEVEWQRDEHGVTYGGKADRIVRNADGLIVIRDYKTTGSIPSSDFRLANSQLHLYAWGLAPWLDEHGLTPDMIEYDYALTYWPKMRVTKAGNLYSNQKVIDEYAALRLLEQTLDEDGHDHKASDERFDSYMEKARTEGVETFFPRNAMPVNETVIKNLLDEQEQLIDRVDELASGATPVRNTGRHCDFMCPYTQICVGDLYGNDTGPLKDMMHPLTP